PRILHKGREGMRTTDCADHTDGSCVVACAVLNAFDPGTKNSAEGQRTLQQARRRITPSSCSPSQLGHPIVAREQQRVARQRCGRSLDNLRPDVSKRIEMSA